MHRKGSFAGCVWTVGLPIRAGCRERASVSAIRETEQPLTEPPEQQVWEKRRERLGRAVSATPVRSATSSWPSENLTVYVIGWYKNPLKPSAQDPVLTSGFWRRPARRFLLPCDVGGAHVLRRHCGSCILKRTRGCGFRNLGRSHRYRSRCPRPVLLLPRPPLLDAQNDISKKGNNLRTKSRGPGKLRVWKENRFATRAWRG